MFVQFVKPTEKAPKVGLFFFYIVLILIFLLPSCVKDIRIPMIKGETTPNSSLNKNAPDGAYFVSYETMPEFPGGNQGFIKFLKENARLQIGNHKSTSIWIYLSFIVDQEGRLSEIEVIRGAAEKYNQEAIRIMKASPAWIPGKIRGKPTKSKMSLRISFKEDSLN